MGLWPNNIGWARAPAYGNDHALDRMIAAYGMPPEVTVKPPAAGGSS